MTPTHADEFLSLHVKYHIAEDAMIEAILRILGFDCASDEVDFDDYDSSFEVYNIRNDYRATKEQCEAIFELGFAKFWIHHLDKAETHYWLRTGEGPHESRKDASGNSFCPSRSL